MAVVFLLMGIGIVNVYSSSAISALDKYGSSAYFLLRQTLWILIGLSAGFFFVNHDFKKLRAWVRPLLLASFILLVLDLVIGRKVGGARRWIRIGPIGFEPSELVKLTLILFVADYCDRKKSRMEDFKKGLLPLLAVIGLFCGLILVQPDLGTPVLILMTCVTMIFLGGAKPSHLVRLGLVLVFLVSIAAWQVPYRRKRILSFLHPMENARGSSYQLVQSLIALGSGGLMGQGLGESRSKLFFLPEQHTDFIFPVFAEEFGALGSWLVLLLFGLLAVRGFRIAARTNNLFGSLVASGITLVILYQAILNIGIVTGCLPTKGLPLPFLSFGGSSMVVLMAGVGIVLNISRYAKEQ